MPTPNKKFALSSFAEFVFEDEDTTLPNPNNKEDETADVASTQPGSTGVENVDQTTDQQSTPAEVPTTDSTTPPVEDKPEESKGVDAQLIVTQLKALIDATNSSVQIGAPSDIHGHATSYGDIEKAIQKIEDVAHYYEEKKEHVSFYCWNINWNDWKSGQAVEQKFKAAGVTFEKFHYVDLDTLTKYFKANPDDAGLLKSISLGLDSKGAKAFAKGMSNGDAGSLD